MTGLPVYDRGFKSGGPAILMARPYIAIITTIAALASLAGCAAGKPKLPPGVRPSVEVGPPPKSDIWKAIATTEDKDRLARLGLAWQEAISDSSKTNGAEI